MSPLKQMLAMIAGNTLKINTLKAEMSVLESKNIQLLADIIIAIDNATGHLQTRMDKIAPLKKEKKTDLPKTGEK